MTPLRQRMIEDMTLRGLAPTTQRSYIHYVAGFAKYFNLSPEKLDLEAVRQYELHLLEERRLSSVITPKPARHDHFKTGQPKGLRTTSL
jgi:Phage integrase, N-terminal SAM-like domain